MSIKIESSFEDEPVSRFCYDIDGKKIKIYFSGYYDVQSKDYIEQNCCCVVNNWKAAKSKLYKDDRFFSLDSHIGVFSLILHAKYSNNILEMVVNTIDNRYIVLQFTEPEIRYEII